MIARRLRAVLFQLRAIAVFVALAVGIVVWMLFGIIAAAMTSLVRALFSRRRHDQRSSRPSRGSFPPDSSSPPGRLGILPTWLRA